MKARSLSTSPVTCCSCSFPVLVWQKLKEITGTWCSTSVVGAGWRTKQPEWTVATSSSWTVREAHLVSAYVQLTGGRQVAGCPFKNILSSTPRIPLCSIICWLCRAFLELRGLGCHSHCILTKVRLESSANIPVSLSVSKQSPEALFKRSCTA